MKFKFSFMIFAFLIVLSSCSGGGSTEIKSTLVNVTQAMENVGLKIVNIHPKGTKQGKGIGLFNELNNVAANTYAIDSYTMDKSASKNGPFNVNVYIYVFDSEQALSDGRKDFNSKLELAKLISTPVIYEKKNVMVV